MTKKLILRRNAAYAALHSTYWMIYCVSISYAGVFLLAKAYSNTEIGIIMALGYILGLVLQPVIAAMADRSKKVSSIGMICLLTAIIGVICVILLFLQGHTWMVFTTFVLFIAVELVLQPLVNAFAFYLEQKGTEIRFGICRGIGSFSYAVLSAILGWLTVKYPVWILPAAGIVTVFLLLAIMLGFQKSITHTAAAGQTVDRSWEPKHTVSTASAKRSFRFLLLGTAGIFIGHSFINNFVIQMVVSVGGTSADMGVLCAYAALLELPAMWSFDYLRKRFSCISMLKFSAVFFFIKVCAFLLASQLLHLYIAMLFQALSFAVYLPASVRYANEVMPPEDNNKAQAFLTATITVGNIFSCACGGALIDAMGFHNALFLAGGFTAFGTMAVLFGMKRGEKTVMA